MGAGKEVGLTSRVYVQMERSGKKYYGFNIGKKTIESLVLQPGDLCQFRLRSMDGQEEKYRREVDRNTDEQFSVYIPAKISEELELSKGDLLDVFIQKV